MGNDLSLSFARIACLYCWKCFLAYTKQACSQVLLLTLLLQQERGKVKTKPGNYDSVAWVLFQDKIYLIHGILSSKVSIGILECIVLERVLFWWTKRSGTQHLWRQVSFQPRSQGLSSSRQKHLKAGRREALGTRLVSFPISVFYMLYKHYPPFGMKICMDICPRTWSVLRSEQFSESEARGKL